MNRPPHPAVTRPYLFHERRRLLGLSSGTDNPLEVAFLARLFDGIEVPTTPAAYAKMLDRTRKFLAQLLPQAFDGGVVDEARRHEPYAGGA